MLEKGDDGVGTRLHLRMKVPDNLACYAIGSDGSDGCRVAFAVKEYVAGEKGMQLNGAIVQTIDVFYPTI
jgi:hypothetical protein